MVYNFETRMVEELIHIKSDDKESDNKMSEIVQSFSKLCVSKDTSEARGIEAGSLWANNPSAVGCSKDIKTLKVGGPEDDSTFEAHPDEENSKDSRWLLKSVKIQEDLQIQVFTSIRVNSWK